MSTNEDRAAGIVRRMGFPNSEVGPYVSKLRESVLQQVREGMVSRSGGTWAPEADTLTYEERAKEILAWDWEIFHGATYRVEALDGIRHYRDILPWLGDRFREGAMLVRTWWRRRIVGRENPYT